MDKTVRPNTKMGEICFQLVVKKPASGSQLQTRYGAVEELFLQLLLKSCDAPAYRSRRQAQILTRLNHAASHGKTSKDFVIGDRDFSNLGESLKRALIFRVLARIV